jgi:hypothetical protein
MFVINERILVKILNYKVINAKFTINLIKGNSMFTRGGEDYKAAILIQHF